MDEQTTGAAAAPHPAQGDTSPAPVDATLATDGASPAPESTHAVPGFTPFAPEATPAASGGASARPSTGGAASARGTAPDMPEVAETSPTPGLRAQKKQKARAAMHRAAVTLAAEHGASAITVEMIADAADVSPRTFFNYWESKEAAILGFTPDRTDRAVDLLRNRPLDERPETSLRAVIRQMAAQMPADQELRRTKRLAMDREPALRLASGRVMTSLQEGLTTALAERLGGEDARDRATVLVQLAFGAAHAAFALSLTHGTTLDAEFDRIYGLIDRGDVGI